jgi:hypothetical protein
MHKHGETIASSPQYVHEHQGAVMWVTVTGSADGSAGAAGAVYMRT